MSKTHEVLSAFLDDEPFEPRDLESALSDANGRALLIDLIALRRLVQPIDAMPALQTPPVRWTAWRFSAAAAVLLLAMAGGYLAGTQRAEPADTAAPSPTRIVEAVPFTPAGGPQ